MIVSFDIGKKNFAFVVEEENEGKNEEENGKIILFKNLDLTKDTNKKLYLDAKLSQLMIKF